jgi:hypothetical protein
MTEEQKERRAALMWEELRRRPDFLQMLRRSQEDEKAGRFVTPEEIARKYLLD